MRCAPREGNRGRQRTQGRDGEYHPERGVESVHPGPRDENRRDASHGGAFNLTPTLVLNLPTGPAAGSKVKSIVVGDFNFDGLPDIAVANADSSTVSVFLNTSTFGGNLSFSTPVNVPAGPTAPVGMVSADFNSDGAPDLAHGFDEPGRQAGHRLRDTGQSADLYGRSSHSPGHASQEQRRQQVGCEVPSSRNPRQQQDGDREERLARDEQAPHAGGQSAAE